MNVCFSTLGCPAWGLARVIDEAQRLAYDGIELRFLEGDDALWARPELLGEGLPETRKRLKDAGLVVACVDSRSFFHHRDAATRRAASEETERIVDVAAALSAPGVRVFGDRVQEGATLESTRGWIADSLGALRDKARPAGVEIWLETHGEFARGASTRSVLERVSGEGVGAVWDPANAYSEFGEAPEEGARALGRAIRHVHLKDLAPAPPPRLWTPALLGRGEFPAERAIALLLGAGFTGFVSFEWEKRWHPAIEEPEVALPHFRGWMRDCLRRAETPPETGTGRPGSPGR